MNRFCSLAASLGLIAGTAMAQTIELDGNWIINVGEDPSSYAVAAMLKQDSANTIKDEYATRDVTPQLAFLCAPGKPEISVRINWQRFISSFNTEVGFKVDGGKTLWQKWGVDQSNKITSSKSVADSQLLIEQLKNGSELLVEVSPYSEAPVKVRFDLAGFAQALDQLQSECL